MPRVEAVDPSQLFRLIDLLGVLGNGLLGAAVARSARFDLVGFVVVALLSGLGGGMLRDLLLNTQPVALTDVCYLPMAVLAAVVGYVINTQGVWTLRALRVADMLALGCWSATGAGKALSLGLDWLPAIFLGVLTATGGGIIRDLVVGRAPAIFVTGSPLYAVIGVLGAAEMTVITRLHHPNWGMAASIVTCGVLGWLAHHRHWTLPEPVSVALPRLRRRR